MTIRPVDGIGVVGFVAYLANIFSPTAIDFWIDLVDFISLRGFLPKCGKKVAVTCL